MPILHMILKYGHFQKSSENFRKKPEIKSLFRTKFSISSAHTLQRTLFIVEHIHRSVRHKCVELFYHCLHVFDVGWMSFNNSSRTNRHSILKFFVINIVSRHSCDKSYLENLLIMSRIHCYS